MNILKLACAASTAALLLCGCEVNNPPDTTPTNSTTVIHDKTPGVTVNPAPNITVNPPASSSHTETHTTTVTPPGTSGSSSSTQSSTTTG